MDIIVGLEGNNSIAEAKCSANQVFSTCTSSCAEPKCIDEGPKICAAICGIGCTCAKGYVRDPKGNCVLPKDCPNVPTVCPNNEHIDPCIKPCESTCKDPSLGQRCRPYCGNDTIPQCVCNDGYLRDQSFDNCVLAKDCCPEHEHRSYFERLCEATCNEPYKNLYCKPISTFLPDCACDEGYIRNNDNKCVLREECCGPNMLYTTCGSACQQTCENFNKPILFCTLQCVIGCVCKPGYVKDSKGNCILKEKCPGLT